MLELPFFYPDCSEVNPKNMQLLLEIVFRWWVCLKRKMMVLHLPLAVMEAFRSKLFSLNCCLSVNLLLSLGEVFGSNKNSGSVVKEQMMAVVTVIISHLALIPWSGKGLVVPCQGLSCLLIWDMQPEQTQFLIRLSAGHLRY